LLYFVRTANDVLFRDVLDELQGRVRSFRYHVLVSRPDPGWQGEHGRISRDFICTTVTETKDRTFFLCGPPPFMDAARNILAGLKVEPERIRQETFGGVGTAPKTRQPHTPEGGFAIEFVRSGKKSTIQKGQSLLEAAAEAGVEISSACGQGQCGTCKTRLLDGHVEMTTEHGLDPESKARGFVLPCVSHTDGDVRLDA